MMYDLLVKYESRVNLVEERLFQTMDIGVSVLMPLHHH